MAEVGDPFDWGRRAHVTRLLKDAFDLQFEDQDAPYTCASAQAVWELRATAYGPVRTLVQSLEQARRAELYRAWLDLFEGYRVPGGVRQPRRYLLVLGRRR